MPAPRQMLLWLVDYLVWADREMLSGCTALSPDDLNRDLKISYASILGTLRHMYIAERDWTRRLRASVTPPIVEAGDDELFANLPADLDLAELLERWPAVGQRLRRFVETVSDADLETEFEAMKTRIPRWKLLAHVGNHATLHRGQVMGLIRQLGKQPPGTDLFTFHRFHPGSPNA